MTSKPPTPRNNLGESFQQYAARVDSLCTCGAVPTAYTSRHPWEHRDECQHHNVYLAWRGFVEAVLPGRRCLEMPRDFDPNKVEHFPTHGF